MRPAMTWPKKCMTTGFAKRKEQFKVESNYLIAIQLAGSVTYAWKFLCWTSSPPHTARLANFQAQQRTCNEKWLHHTAPLKPLSASDNVRGVVVCCFLAILTGLGKSQPVACAGLQPAKRLYRKMCQRKTLVAKVLPPSEDPTMSGESTGMV